MNKTDFLTELKNALLIEDQSIDESTQVQLTSLTRLSVMAFVDENFNKQIDINELAKINSVADIITMIGSENIG